MASIMSFISLSLDGCYADASSSMDWAHSNDPEQAAFTASNAKGGGRLVFGRVTYEMMKAFWPTPAAAQMMPEVAKQMNAMPKIVFSRSMKSADWSNTTVMNGDLLANVRKLKSDGGPDMAILGSGSVVAQLIEAALLDELQVMLVPVSLGGGKRLFESVKGKAAWKTVETRPFKNGNVFLRYRPA